MGNAFLMEEDPQRESEGWRFNSRTSQWNHPELDGYIACRDWDWFVVTIKGIEGPYASFLEASQKARPCSWCEGIREVDESCACTEDS